MFGIIKMLNYDRIDLFGIFNSEFKSLSTNPSIANRPGASSKP